MLYDLRHDLDADGKILWAAADYMEEHGWCQKMVRRRADGAVCMLGAMRFSLGQREVEDLPVWKLLTRYLGMEPEVWNDGICKSKDQAVAALRDAARHTGR